MKKTLVVVALVLAAILGIAPNFVGGRAEAQYGGLLAQLSQNGLRVEKHSYQRGWMGAQATTELVLPLPRIPQTTDDKPKLPEALRFTLLSDVRHGPLIPSVGGALAEIDTKVLLNGEQLFPDDYPATLQTVVALDGGITSQLDLPAKAFTVESGKASIEFGGLAGTLVTDPTFTHSSITLSSAGGKIEENGREVLRLGQLDIHSNAERSSSGLMLGDGKFLVSELRLSDSKRGELFDAREIALNADSRAEGEQVIANLTTQIQSLRAAGKQYGRSELKFSMGNIYAPVLLKIQQAMDEIRTQNIDPQMQGIAIMSTLMTQAPLLLKHDPRIAIDRLYLETPEGAIDGSLVVQSVGMTFDDLQGGLGFLQKLVANAAISLPEPLARQLSLMQAERQVTRRIEMRQRLDEEFKPPTASERQAIIKRTSDQQIAALVNEQLVLRKGAQLESRAVFDKGKLTVNGQVLDLPFLPPVR